MSRILLCIVTVLFATACANRPPQTETRTPTLIRVLTYNIHHGEGTDGRLDLERIAGIIRDTKADLVALQEVDDRATRSGGVSQTAELARLTGMHGAFGQAMPFQGGGYGQAILARWPIESTAIYNLPQQARREPRIAFAAFFTNRLVFVSTHLDHEIESVRVEQARQLAANLSTNRLPVILTGDFNAVPESETMKTFASGWIDAAAANPEPTIPSDTPRRRIDYILLSPTHDWRVVETRVLAEAVASDHRPVLSAVEALR